MNSSEIITLIICLTIVAIIAMGIYTVLWMFTYDKETNKKKVKNKIRTAIEAAEKEADALFEKNLKLLAEKEKQVDLKIEAIIRANSDLEEENEFLKKQLELQESVSEEITPIETIEEE